MRPLLILALLAVAGCSIPSLPELEGEEHTLAVDPAFSSAERAEVQAAVDVWRTESGGRFNVRVTDGAGEVELVRGPTGGARLGRFDRVAMSIALDADALAAYPRGVQSMTANMLGQFVGMPLHDGCGVLGRNCLRPDFTEEDRASCALVGACD